VNGVHQEVREALLKHLSELGAFPGIPISLYDIGIPLLDAGFDQHDIVSVLFALHDEKIIQLIDGNRLVLV
jgi:hypothetical protein